MIIIVILNYRNRDFKSLRGRERNNEVRNKISMINLTDYKASLTATSDRIIASNFSPSKKRAHTLLPFSRILITDPRKTREIFHGNAKEHVRVKHRILQVKMR